MSYSWNGQFDLYTTRGEVAAFRLPGSGGARNVALWKFRSIRCSAFAVAAAGPKPVAQFSSSSDRSLSSSARCRVYLSHMDLSVAHCMPANIESCMFIWLGSILQNLDWPRRLTIDFFSVYSCCYIRLACVPKKVKIHFKIYLNFTSKIDIFPFDIRINYASLCWHSLSLWYILYYLLFA